MFVANGCAACHGSLGQGTRFAPTLIGIGDKFPDGKLDSLLRHPTAKMRGGGMPAVTVNDDQLHQLTGYLASLNLASAHPAGTVQSASAQPAAAASSSARPTAASGGAAATTPSSPAVVAALHAAPLSPQALAGQHVFERYNCETCHGIGGLHGTVAAPGLAGTASILPAPMLENLLRHHSTAMQKGGMPLTNMKPEEMKQLVTYIRSMPAEGTEP